MPSFRAQISSIYNIYHAFFLKCALWEGKKKKALSATNLWRDLEGFVALLRLFVVDERNLRRKWFGLRKPRLRNFLNAQEWQLSWDKERNTLL